MANISQNVNIEMLEKLPDGTYKRKYPKTRSESGVTFDEHLADYANPHEVTKSDVGLSNVDNTSDASKPISSATQTALNAKADKTQVLTNVPANAKFTDTVYTHPTSHPASMITESSTKRFVSDSEKSTWNSKSDTDTITTINGKTGAISKADIVALGIPASDTNTTYTEITTAEIDAGTSSTRRTITGRRLKYLSDKFAPSSHTHTWSQVTGKPSTFAPSSHTQAWSTITNQPDVMTASASNTNGRYVRFSDGTQICSHTTSGPMSGGRWTWSFPASFAAQPRVFVFPTTEGIVWQASKTLTNVTIGTNSSSSQTYLQVMAIGWWK